MGVGAWFNGFCSNLVVQDEGTISTRYKAITRRLNTDFWSTTSETSHSLYVGSYGRNTAIQGFSDLDMVFELPNFRYVSTAIVITLGMVSRHFCSRYGIRCRRTYLYFEYWWPMVR